MRTLNRELGEMGSETEWETDTIGGRLGWAIKGQPPVGKRRGIGLLISRLEERKAPGANYPSISGYLQDQVDPPLAFITAAAGALGVREAWLAFGEGAPTEQEEAARREHQDEDDASSAYSRILSTLPDLARLENLDPSVCQAFVMYVVRLEETIQALGGNLPDEELEDLAIAAWGSMTAPVSRWQRRTKQPIEPRAFADYAMAMLTALSLSLRLAAPGLRSAEDYETWDALSGGRRKVSDARAHTMESKGGNTDPGLDA